MYTNGVLSLLTRNPLFRFYKDYIFDSILIVKRRGFKALIRERGWKVVAAVVTYYLVRDTIVYIVVPYLVAKQIL
jgi:hypothetical protein